MPYNTEIEARIQKIISKWRNRDTKKMFGSDEELAALLEEAKGFVGTLAPK